MSQLETNTQADKSPVTLTEVVIISKIRSTPAIKAMASNGKPIEVSTIVIMTITVPGIAAAPTEASEAVISKIISCVNESSIP